MSLTKNGQTQDAVFGALLLELQHNRTTHTELIAYLRGGLVNNVLMTELVTFDTTGAVMREWDVAMGSVAIANHSTTGDVTAHAGGQGPGAPGGGVGVAFVKKATAATLNLTGHVLTLYGTPGERCTVQVFTKGQPPAWGPA